MPGGTVREARVAELPAVAARVLSSGEIFRDVGMGEIADDDGGPSLEELGATSGSGTSGWSLTVRN